MCLPLESAPAVSRTPHNSINNIILSATCSCRTTTTAPRKMLLKKSLLIASGSLSCTSSRMLHSTTMCHLHGFLLLGPCVSEALPPSVTKSFAQDRPVPLPWGPPDPGPLSHSVSFPCDRYNLSRFHSGPAFLLVLQNSETMLCLLCTEAGLVALSSAL